MSLVRWFIGLFRANADRELDAEAVVCNDCGLEVKYKDDDLPEHVRRDPAKMAKINRASDHGKCLYDMMDRDIARVRKLRQHIQSGRAIPGKANA